ncbi:CHRD domain-containing protein [uncultured Paludibaculum sp.]|uniref:CHRD domain-containing protein n=1 Tax=uncultured Paludibaculum sp. TaxID=1765020 RepID=UPI002AAB10CD|nr:CHRD domain-containing protein [uncultured Paludibaculum sp.]
MKKTLFLGFALALSTAAQSVETIPFRVNLSSLNELPAISGDASTAVATVLVHVSRDASGQIVSGAVDFKSVYKLAVTSNITAMHIHRGAATANGPVVIDSTLSSPVADATTGVLSLQGPVPPTNTNGLTALRDLVANPSGFYLNMHTARNPSGELRGQLLPAEKLVLMGLMNPGNEVPAIADSTAKATCAITVIAARNADGFPISAEVIFDANYSGFPEGTNFTGFHIHNGPAGVNAGVVINTGLAGPVAANATGGNLKYEVQIDPANGNQAAAVAGLFVAPSRYYVNMHTTVNSGGAIRGQLRSTDKMVFQTQLLTTNEVPATNIDASAGASFTMHTLRNNEGWIVAGVAVFDVNYTFPGSVQVTGTHIHDGAAGANGPVVINSGLSAANQPVSPTGFGNVYRQNVQSSDLAIRSMNQVSIDPHSTYFNVHTSDFPGGVFRNQTGPMLDKPVISAVISGVSDPTNTTVAPLGWVTVFGSNLLSATGNEAGYESKAPLHLNGTTVLIGDKPAAIIVLARDSALVPTEYIVAQVPADVSFGAQSVTVVTSGGSSDASSIKVASVAPALFFDKIGGIAFHNSDLTLVRPESPAVPGEQIGIVGTNLGLTLPPMETGQYATADAFAYVLPSPTVKFGTTDATVVGAAMLPGQAGVYAVLVVVPNASGNNQVTITQTVGGNAVTSNAVTVPVQ